MGGQEALWYILYFNIEPNIPNMLLSKKPTIQLQKTKKGTVENWNKKKKFKTLIVNWMLPPVMNE